MGAGIDHKESAPVAIDATKPWKRQFFECEAKGPEPPVNRSGFWHRPRHGIQLGSKKDQG